MGNQQETGAGVTNGPSDVLRNTESTIWTKKDEPGHQETRIVGDLKIDGQGIGTSKLATGLQNSRRQETTLDG